jgi:hypothetical protein
MMNTVLERQPTAGLARSFNATIFCDLPQTKPTSANEANAKKPVKTMLEDERRKPLENRLTTLVIVVVR